MTTLLQAKVNILHYYADYRKQNQTSFFKINPVNRDIFALDCIIPGPEGSIWEKGEFVLQINFPKDFPENPPEAHFIPPIFHPNVNEQNGNLSLELLDPQKWKKETTMTDILLSAQKLLDNPNTESAVNNSAKDAYLKYKENNSNDEYIKKVNECIERSKQPVQSNNSQSPGGFGSFGGVGSGKPSSGFMGFGTSGFGGFGGSGSGKPSCGFAGFGTTGFGGPGPSGPGFGNASALGNASGGPFGGPRNNDGPGPSGPGFGNASAFGKPSGGPFGGPRNNDGPGSSGPGFGNASALGNASGGPFGGPRNNDGPGPSGPGFGNASAFGKPSGGPFGGPGPSGSGFGNASAFGKPSGIPISEPRNNDGPGSSGPGFGNASALGNASGGPFGGPRNNDGPGPSGPGFGNASAFGKPSGGPFGGPGPSGSGFGNASAFGKPSGIPISEPRNNDGPGPSGPGFGNASALGNASGGPFGGPRNNDGPGPSGPGFGNASAFGKPSGGPFGGPGPSGSGFGNASAFGKPSGIPISEPRNNDGPGPSGPGFGNASAFGKPSGGPFGGPRNNDGPGSSGPGFGNASAFGKPSGGPFGGPGPSGPGFGNASAFGKPSGGPFGGPRNNDGPGSSGPGFGNASAFGKPSGGPFGGPGLSGPGFGNASAFGKPSGGPFGGPKINKEKSKDEADIKTSNPPTSTNINNLQKRDVTSKTINQKIQDDDYVMLNQANVQTIENAGRQLNKTDITQKAADFRKYLDSIKLRLNKSFQYAELSSIELIVFGLNNFNKQDYIAAARTLISSNPYSSTPPSLLVKQFVRALISAFFIRTNDHDILLRFVKELGSKEVECDLLLQLKREAEIFNKNGSKDETPSFLNNVISALDTSQAVTAAPETRPPIFESIIKDDVGSLRNALGSSPSINQIELTSNERNAFPTNKPTLLEYAAFYGSENCFNYLYNEKKYEITNDITKYALCGGNNHIYEVILKSGKSFLNDLEYAIKFHHHELFKKSFLSYYNDDYGTGETAYDIVQSKFTLDCIKYFNFQTLRFLIEFGADVNNCMINQALKRDIHSLFIFLLGLNVDVNKQDENGFTAIHCAIRADNVTAVKILLENKRRKVDLTLKEKGGKTPKDFASIVGNSEIKDLLSNK
ncbi:hypothetical protein M9Y10_028264 [Tritrichomonas musculus]|uniref:UBC core domain-containing protein n=1 Tax=Tritrichomonas musculus TaxID=1915356 RepID=A0ABR2KIT8_9EUKA